MHRNLVTLVTILVNWPSNHFMDFTTTTLPLKFIGMQDNCPTSHVSSGGKKFEKHALLSEDSTSSIQVQLYTFSIHLMSINQASDWQMVRIFYSIAFLCNFRA